MTMWVNRLHVECVYCGKVTTLANRTRHMHACERKRGLDTPEKKLAARKART